MTNNRKNTLGFLAGIKVALRTPAFIVRHPSLWVWCGLPFVINVAATLGAWWWMGGLVTHLIPDALESRHWWATLLRWVFLVVVFLLRLLVTFAAFYIVGSLLAAPFNELLSRRTENLLGGRKSAELEPTMSGARLVLVVVGQELQRMALFGGLTLLVVAMSFTAIFSPLVPLIQILFAASFLALDYLAYPLERRGMLLLSHKLAFVRSHAAPCLGFGFVLACIGMVPLTNLFLFPIGAVGGTLLYWQLISRPPVTARITRASNSARGVISADCKST